MALRGGSSLLRSLARLTNSHVAASSRLSSTNQQNSALDHPLLHHTRGHMVGDFRLFCTSPRAQAVSVELSDALKREIEAEKELEAQGKGASPALFPGFTVTSKDAEVRLTKKHNNENILVVFNVNHSVEIGEEAEGEQPPPPVALPPFSIEITKGDERLCFHLELVEAEQPGEYDFQVEEFYLAPAVKPGDKADEDVPSHVYATSGRYIDPEIQELLYVRYLEERGFDGEFLKSLVAFASAHEHSLYINLLNKMKAFIAK